MFESVNETSVNFSFYTRWCLENKNEMTQPESVNVFSGLFGKKSSQVFTCVACAAKSGWISKCKENPTVESHKVANHAEQLKFHSQTRAAHLQFQIIFALINKMKRSHIVVPLCHSHILQLCV